MGGNDDDIAIFCRQVRARSDEHMRAMHALRHADAPAVMVGLLRQELDSMIRVMFILAQADGSYRRTLVAASVTGKRWPRNKGKGYVTDREMVELSAKLQGWAKSVYAFGCAFIHLSDLHDHADRDPVASMTRDERVALFEHLRYYHGPVLSESFEAVVALVPSVLFKIADNLRCYLKDLEQNGQLK